MHDLDCALGESSSKRRALAGTRVRSGSLTNHVCRCLGRESRRKAIDVSVTGARALFVFGCALVQSISRLYITHIVFNPQYIQFDVLLFCELHISLFP